MVNFERLRCNVGQLFFVQGSSVAHCVKLREFHDPGVEFMMRRHRSYLNPFFDVGANVGLFSFLASDILDKDASIVAFEPDSVNVEGFAKNMSETGVTNIRLEKVAVSNDESPLQLGRIDCGLAKKSSEHVETVPGRTIDGFVAATSINPGFIKVDVEGLEWAVIEGASSTLAKKNTLLEMEFSLRDLGDFPTKSESVFASADWVLECHLRDFDRDLLLQSPALSSVACRAKHIQTNQVFWPVACYDFTQRMELFDLLQQSTAQDSSRKWEILFAPRGKYEAIRAGIEHGFEVRQEI